MTATEGGGTGLEGTAGRTVDDCLGVGVWFADPLAFGLKSLSASIERE